MPVRVALPVPTSSDHEYNERTLPHYLNALKAAGAEPVVVPLSETQERVAKLLESVQGVLLPGSGFDVDPERYGEARQPECGDSDPSRVAMDELLLQDAFGLRKPILAICAGTQTFNVWRNGSLIQDLKTPVNHIPGRRVTEAHPVKLAEGSKLSEIFAASAQREPQVNSSHHQAIRKPGYNLRVVAISPADGVIEAIELDAPNHFAVGVQWHPERTYAESEFSRSIFAAFVRAAENWRAPQIETTSPGSR